MPQNETPTDIKFRHALELGILPANWLPPEQPPLAVTNNQRTYDTQLVEIKREVGKPNFGTLPSRNSPRPPKGPMPNGNPSIYPTLANFKHMDRKKFDDLQKAVKADEAPDPAKSNMKGGPPKLGESSGRPTVIANKKQQKRLEELQLAETQFKRLESAFKWIVTKICDCCGELNAAVRTDNPQAYQRARKKYVTLLQNLNIHDPKGEQISPEDGFGYGQVMTWALADVVVEYDKECKQNLISGVTFVGEWIGYHTSSSGVPIKDR